MKKATIYDFARMCNKEMGDCTKCPIASDNNGTDKYCTFFIKSETKEANKLILKWVEEQPKKTYLQDFLGKFPNCEKVKGLPLVCVYSVYNGTTLCARPCIKSEKNCKDCWNEVMEE